MIEVRKIFHSGFLVETDQVYMLFDWYTGQLPEMRADKPLFVFVSHSHGDHYSRKIFYLPAEYFILSNDIDVSAGAFPKGKGRWCSKGVSDRKAAEWNIEERIIPMGPHEKRSIQIPNESMNIETMSSNDLGVAFAVELSGAGENVRIYHAGDLNNWWWDGDAEDRQLEEHYHRELERIKGRHFDVAMIPYDLRLKEPGYGVRDFLRYCSADRIYGMHLNAGECEAKQRLEKDPALDGVHVIL